jgi:hypothetical protein
MYRENPAFSNSNSMSSFDTLNPMSAGDIIDLAVRLYRRNFLTLLKIVIAPSIFAYVGLIIFSIGWNNFTLMRGNTRLAVTLSMIIGGGLIYLIGKAAFYSMLGGASRSLINHFFDGAPLSAREVYRAVREKLWSLLSAMFIIFVLVLGFGSIIFFVVNFIFILFVGFVLFLSQRLPDWAGLILNVILGFCYFLFVFVALLMVYCRMVYVPQVLMVEGKGVFTSISRSFALARGEIRRIAALVLFWFYVAWSLWLLLMIPLGWLGYWYGIDINPFTSNYPFWYEITTQTLTQLSEILIAPIAMLGFTLLYIDSRVRKEGFDVELLANRTLPPLPQDKRRLGYI